MGRDGHQAGSVSAANRARPRSGLPGQVVQIDTVFVSLAPGKAIEHFTAYCPIAKWTVAGRAAATLAAAFVDKVLGQMPFKVSGVQVDGGSEFMAGFKQACRDKRLDLFVLPPKRPQLNGAVERCNGAWRYAFYAVHDLPHQIDKPALRRCLRAPLQSSQTA